MNSLKMIFIFLSITTIGISSFSTKTNNLAFAQSTSNIVNFVQIAVEATTTGANVVKTIIECKKDFASLAANNLGPVCPTAIACYWIPPNAPHCPVITGVVNSCALPLNFFDPEKPQEGQGVCCCFNRALTKEELIKNFHQNL